jgi:parallel beta-helix repeat protein
MRLERLLAPLAVALPLSAAPCLAAGRIPITTGGTISVAGSYILQNDLITPGSPTCEGMLRIDAIAGPIDIDLGWHTVETVYPCSPVAISGGWPVTVRNGFLTSPNVPAFIVPMIIGFDSTPIRIDKIHIDADLGIWLIDSASLVMHQSSVRATLFGLYSTASGDIRIRDSQFEGAQANVMLGAPGKVSVKGSRFTGATDGPDFRVDSATGPVSIGRNYFGSSFSHSASLVVFGDGVRLHGNEVAHSQFDGIVIWGSGHSILGNKIHDNGSCGIVVDPASNTLRGNTFYANGSTDVCVFP